MAILVAGATGTLGGAISRRLLEQGREVRVMTRQPDRAAALRAGGAQVHRADLRDAASLARACEGATHVLTTANAFMGRGGDSVAAVDEARYPIAQTRLEDWARRFIAAARQA